MYSICLKSLIILILTCFECLPAFAYESKEASNNFANELTVCAAFYSISSDAIKQKEEIQKSSNDLSKRYAKIAEDMFSLAITLTSKEVTLARYELSLKDMQKDINSDYSNISIIMNKYLLECKEIYENPEARLKYWRQKQ